MLYNLNMHELHTEPSASSRLNIRIPELLKQQLEQAAELNHQSLTGFVIASAERAAKKTLESQQSMVLSDTDRDLFLNALLNQSQPNDYLKSAFKAHEQLIVE